MEIFVHPMANNQYTYLNISNSSDTNLIRTLHTLILY